MGPTMWPWAMTLTLNFLPEILIKPYPKKRMLDWHGTEGMWVDRMLDSLCKLFTPQPSGLEGYCRHGPGGRAGGCQTCGTHISVTAWWIFSIRSSVELSRPVGVHCHGHMPICPIWACPWAKNLVKFATNWVQTLRNAYLWNCWMDLPHLKFHGLV